MTKKRTKRVVKAWVIMNMNNHVFEGAMTRRDSIRKFMGDDDKKPWRWWRSLGMRSIRVTITVQP